MLIKNEISLKLSWAYYVNNLSDKSHILAALGALFHRFGGFKGKCAIIIFLNRSELREHCDGIINEEESLRDVCINPCYPEGFSQTYFPKGGLLQPPLDYQYWRSYNPKLNTSV